MTLFFPRQFPGISHIPWLFLDILKIPWHFQVFQTSGNPGKQIGNRKACMCVNNLSLVTIIIIIIIIIYYAKKGSKNSHKHKHTQHIQNTTMLKQHKHTSVTSTTPGTERAQALADISCSALCCHSNKTHTPIANLPITAQIQGTSYHSPYLHPGPCSSVGMRWGTDRQTDTQMATGPD